MLAIIYARQTCHLLEVFGQQPNHGSLSIKSPRRRVLYTTVPRFRTKYCTQFAILLVLFVKPMLVQQGGTQSGGAMYKRVIIRNLACTALVCISNLITTVVVIFALLKESPEDNTVGGYGLRLANDMRARFPYLAYSPRS